MSRRLLQTLACVLAFTLCDAISVTIKNSCTYTVQLYDNKAAVPLYPGAETTRWLSNGFIGLFRHGVDASATLAEFSVDGSGRPWYDISIIPPGPGNCGSLGHCKSVTGRTGFNIPMQIQPLFNIGRDTCQTLTCMYDGCGDAYQFPADNSKTHNCPPGTNFRVSFCPGGGGQAPAPAVAPAPTPAPAPSPTTPAPTTPAPTTAEPTVTTSPSEASSSASSSTSGSGSAVTEEDTIMYPLPSESEPTRADEDGVLANTTSSQDESTDVGLVIALVIGGVALVAGAAIVVIRHKKKLLEAREPKHSVDTPSRGDHGFHSPSNLV